MTISIVTVTHRSRAHAPPYVESFLASMPDPGRVPVEFVIIENSGDSEIKRAFEPLEEAGFPLFFRQSENRGFGAGCNAGAAIASNDVLIFANPDIRFIDPIDPVCGFSGSWGTVSQLDRAGRPSSFDVLPERKTILGEIQRKYRRMTPPPPAWLEHVFPVGAFFCVDRQLFTGLGGFDERIFLYHEEAELARRLHAAAGPPIYLPQVRISHHAFGSQQSSESTLRHETEGLFSYCAIVGTRHPLFVRAAMLALMAPFFGEARLRLRIFLHRLFRRKEAR